MNKLPAEVCICTSHLCLCCTTRRTTRSANLPAHDTLSPPASNTIALRKMHHPLVTDSWTNSLHLVHRPSFGVTALSQAGQERWKPTERIFKFSLSEAYNFCLGLEFFFFVNLREVCQYQCTEWMPPAAGLRHPVCPVAAPGSVSPVIGTWMHQPIHAWRHSLNPPLSVLRHGGHPAESPGSSNSTALGNAEFWVACSWYI